MKLQKYLTTFKDGKYDFKEYQNDLLLMKVLGRNLSASYAPKEMTSIEKSIRAILKNTVKMENYSPNLTRSYLGNV